MADASDTPTPPAQPAATPISPASGTATLDPVLAEILEESRAARAWRQDVFPPWQAKTDAAAETLSGQVRALQTGLADHLLEDGQVQSRLVSQAAGDQQTVMAELLNVKNVVTAEVKRVGADFEGAALLAGKLPAVQLQLSAAQVALADGAKEVVAGTQEIKAAGAALKAERSARTRWRKLQGPIIVIVTAVLGALTQRFVLPPAAQNDPGTLLPGRMPTVHASAPSSAPSPE